MDQENIMFSKKKHKKPSTMTDLYLNHNISFGYEDSYNYYHIDVDKILLLRKSDMEYFIRYNDVNKKKVVPLQIKINNFSFGKLYMFPDNTTLKIIYSDDEEFFKKCREIWNKIIEIIGIDAPPFIKNFVETTLDDNEDEYIVLDVEKNTSTIRDKNRNDLVFVFISVFNNIL